MKREEALQIIKQVLDAALQKGILVKLEDAGAVLAAYNILQENSKELGNTIKKS